MALVLDDRVKETSTTTGTGAYTLAGAVTGFQPFTAIGDGNTTWYAATDGTDWEVAIGTYTAAGTTLARTTVISSSNADAPVNWAAGTRTIVCTMPASKAFVGGAFSAMRVYTTTGNTWTKPTGLSYIVVECQGAGAGGAGSVIGTTAGSGGGAGGYARKTIAAASLGASETLIVGTGGAGGISGGVGTAGGSSSFGTVPFLTACGGNPGLTGGGPSGVQGGSGGLSTSGDLNSQGGDGIAGFALGATICGNGLSGGAAGGAGGASYFGGGGDGDAGSATGAGTVAQPGKAFGSGGGGGKGVSGTSASGAAGKGGIVIVWEFI